MIIGNGIDIIETKRISDAINRNEKFLIRIFCDGELNYIKNKNYSVNTISGMFAAKEAISKAVGSGIRDFKWTDIVIYHDELGKPLVRFENNAKLITQKLGIKKVNVSISHINEYAISFAIAEGQHLNINNNIAYENESKIINNETITKILPTRKKKSHKGDYGRVGIVAGSIGMTGANYLSSTAALRSGSGLVYSVIPKSLNIILESKTTEIITKPIEDNNTGSFILEYLDDLIEGIKNLDVIAIGPGLGVDIDKIEIVKEILRLDKPIVLDADGINCIAQNSDILSKRENTTVITPHPGELGKLLNVTITDIQNDRVKYAKLASSKFNAITVLKGYETIVCDLNGDFYINTTGNPGMATAGSGDVLTGMIASFIGQNIEPIHASIIAVFLHGLAGDLAAIEEGEYGLIASDILKNIPKAILKSQII